MKQKIANNKQAEVSIRDGFGEGFLEVAERNPAIVGLTADLTESVRMQEFAEKYPDRFFQIGIAEQNMAGIAAGLALSGHIPYMGSFACFQPYRNLDQIRTSICIMKANVKIISSHAGFSYPADGIQIQALEDVGMMSMLPNMTVLVPADAEQARQMAILAAEVEGPVYLRLGREKTPFISTLANVNNAKQLKIGQAEVLMHGSDIAFFAYGYMVRQCLEVAAELAQRSIHATVVNMHTIKPLDVGTVLEVARLTGRVIVAEEHQQIGGLGTMIASVLLSHDVKTKFAQVAVVDDFGDTAQTVAEMWQRYGLDTQTIMRTALAIM